MLFQIFVSISHCLSHFDKVKDVTFVPTIDLVIDILIFNQDP